MSASFHEAMSIMDHDLIEGVARTLSLSTRDEVNKLKDALFPSLLCAATKAADVPALEKLINSVSGGVRYAAVENQIDFIPAQCSPSFMSQVVLKMVAFGQVGR